MTEFRSLPHRTAPANRRARDPSRRSGFPPPTLPFTFAATEGAAFRSRGTVTRVPHLRSNRLWSNVFHADCDS